ncbi:hypothetical protein ACMHYO_07330 [Allopusillimonas ginsengisoli]|uniref:hypothetical protein n=1 Tax=Allopusillimonas ginsengisoli TaxID=453575 RepID=UPI0039C41480
MANAWQDGWITHQGSHVDAANVELAHPQFDDDSRAPDQLTEAQHRLLHEITDHHASVVLPEAVQLHPLPPSSARVMACATRVSTRAIAPLLQPPRFTS